MFPVAVEAVRVAVMWCVQGVVVIGEDLAADGTSCEGGLVGAHVGAVANAVAQRTLFTSRSLRIDRVGSTANECVTGKARPFNGEENGVRAAEAADSEQFGVLNTNVLREVFVSDFGGDTMYYPTGIQRIVCYVGVGFM